MTQSMSQTAADPSAGADKSAVRATVFTHLAGLVVAPTVSALWERGALDPLVDARGPVGFDELVDRTHANRGYLRVAHATRRRSATRR